MDSESFKEYNEGVSFFRQLGIDTINFPFYLYHKSFGNVKVAMADCFFRGSMKGIDHCLDAIVYGPEAFRKLEGYFNLKKIEKRNLRHLKNKRFIREFESNPENYDGKVLLATSQYCNASADVILWQKEN